MKDNFYSELWKNLNWKLARKKVFRLQKRIYKAMLRKDYKQVRNLQKLLLRSRAAKFLAIRRVTQENQGKKTAGIDGKASLKFEERFALFIMLEKYGHKWKHNKLREIPIPKKDGSTRMLKVPTIADRAWQAWCKLAIEPAHEATFHERSYGFRPGRSAQDTQKLLFSNLRSSSKGHRKYIYEMDIAKCFDRIDHRHLMNRIIAPQSIKQGLWGCLKSGTNINFPEQGVPQGGVISPLLANISLNGIEDLGKCIRYADDLVFIIDPGFDEDPTKKWHKRRINQIVKSEKELIEYEVSQFLKERGLEIKPSKTRLVKATDGFDFLGWHFYVQSNNQKFRSVPSEENFKAFKEKAKAIINSSAFGARVKAKKLSSVVRGWRNYHKFCKLDGSRFSLWHMSYRAFKVFNKEKKMNKYKAKSLIQKAFPNPGWKENDHIMVKNNKSPFDGDIAYWSKRNSKLYDGVTSQALKRQDHKCEYCGLKFSDDETVELHHVDGNHNNWDKKNLVAVHRSCHHYIHMKQ
ncbi:MAG: RNA-dependent DNA polymerase [Okeania sp. SIO3H1]|uniref:group II intron reverse transcriptase/maturase n=1 Tax=Okeania sp. SIO1I7 TaxID=2607772 RepID=UPI0013C622E2|nr:reverse transcriptase domain-containing protein [Okeania sp. SIO1I7]NEN90049.1 RNA-dependent DNA polymerase [Okeania sp. SIO3H1]NET26186.1 RNA-dependent DNA polymerase [Okeania sp. SIO1I7]NET26193.1 RNA-dependent DNA polymerase [Okeania sp. SIO1I7]